MENIRKNIFALRDILNSEKASLVFLSETQAYQCDLPGIAQYLDHDYCYAMNSDDLFDHDLPLVNSRAKGGTMVMWSKWLDPHIKVVSTSTSSFLPVVLTLPDCLPSVHVAVYLPTHGQDAEFMSELATLQNCLDSLNTAYSYPCIFIRGDANVNCKNTRRVNILTSFMERFNLTRTAIHHKTYHHFVGGGLFDSNVDVILHSDSVPGMQPEQVKNILCQKNIPDMGSHHDAIVSVLFLPQDDTRTATDDNICAPRLDIKRRKINWTEEGTQEYAMLVATQLKKIRETWLKPDSQVAMSVLLQLTNCFLDMAASATNESRPLSTKIKSKKKIRVPKVIKEAKNKLNRAHKKLKFTENSATQGEYILCRKLYHQTVRNLSMQEDLDRDTKLFSIIGENPSKVFSQIRSLRNTKRSATDKLTVGNRIYCGKYVADGFYNSMTTLKQCDLASLESECELASKLQDYATIMKLCEGSYNLPRINLDKSTKLLHKIKRNVRDHYSITSQHYINAGQEGLLHFNLLLNGIIAEVKNAGCEELNTAHGLIFFKGHNKDKTSDRSYRTISTCPFLAKSVDMYVRDLYLDLWQNLQADTQYQGPGSSHELASLLLTEVLQYSLYSSKQPVYVLVLDAQSAFDRCLRQVLIAELYKAKVSPAAILLIEKRLASRCTVYEWEGALMGPAKDSTGFEQGGVNSSDFYKLYNNEQLKTAQESKLGVNIGSGTISAIGQADDVLLASDSLHSLQLLVYLTEQYCAKFRVKLEPTKTKLLCYCTDKQRFNVDHALNTHNITINKQPVLLKTEAEHVGVLRSTAGNLPHLLNRIAKHKSALHALLPAGLARRHRGNPAATLKLGQIYATPVLLSGVASLVLSKAEIRILDGHFVSTLRKLMKLHDKTPRSFIYLMAGTLPVSAILHQKQMSLFLMICHLAGDPLLNHAEYTLLHQGECAKSWFVQIKEICLQYHLPHPLLLLKNPPLRQNMKKLVKLKITEYWQRLLTVEASSMPSLQHLSPMKHSVARPHPLWEAAGSSPHEINKTIILARMMSGRYYTEKLCRFWTDNRQGYCLSATCHEVVGDLEHLLLHCPALEATRRNLHQMWLVRSQVLPPLHEVVRCVLAAPVSVRMAFILDCVAMPPIITLYQTYGMEVLRLVLHMTRTYAYGLHRRKQILLGRWPFSTRNPDCKNTDSKYLKCSVAGSPAEAVQQPLSMPNQSCATPCCPGPCQDVCIASPYSVLYSGSRPANYTIQTNHSVLLSSRAENTNYRLYHGLPVDVGSGEQAGIGGGLVVGRDAVYQQAHYY